MTKEQLPKNIRKKIIAVQVNEQTEYEIYKKLSKLTLESHNKKVLMNLADDEKKHYLFWKNYLKQPAQANSFVVYIHVLAAQLLGVTFAVKLMEKGEKNEQARYHELVSSVPEIKYMISDEERHEKELVKLITEDHLSYVGSIVLGLNDALVELTGALAGLTLALQNAQLVAVAALVTGIAASLSMAASEYLSVKSEQGQTLKNPITSALYTGTTYFMTVILLITPYFVINNLYLSLVLSLIIALCIILLFTFYTTVTHGVSFWKRFVEMASISLGVAALTFLIGYVVRQVLHIEI